ncbi:dynactin subunit 2 [Lycorma delicatula]|uniref:dynactin subunit 2 n=1 Tax=Lycorma delicatula TaxID=130591 RepID=UPI003F518E41
MADPKYANLFGIAYDQPDVYETNDLPEAEQNTDIYEEDTDSNIEKLHISAPEAFSKFKDKSLVANKVDFSDRLSKTRRTGYDTRSGEWELAGSDEKETISQKYQRLQCEMKELLEEISALKSTAKEGAQSEAAPYSNFSTQLESMLKQISNLNLQETLGGELSDLKQSHSDQVKKLLSQLDQIKVSDDDDDKKDIEKADEGKDAVIKYKLSVSPGQAVLAQSTRLADLEQRLNRIETCIGASSPKLARLAGGTERSLIEIAQYLSARATLLDPTLLEAADLRVSSLATKLDQVLEKSAVISGSQDADKMQKIEKLYELAKETEQISNVLPQTLDRMNALQGLHQQSSEFTKTLSELETLQARLTASAETNSDMLKQVEEGLKTNLASIKANLESLDNRVKALTNKK